MRVPISRKPSLYVERALLAFVSFIKNHIGVFLAVHGPQAAFCLARCESDKARLPQLLEGRDNHVDMGV